MNKRQFGQAFASRKVLNISVKITLAIVNYIVDKDRDCYTICKSNQRGRMMLSIISFVALTVCFTVIFGTFLWLGVDRDRAAFKIALIPASIVSAWFTLL